MKNKKEEKIVEIPPDVLTVNNSSQSELGAAAGAFSCCFWRTDEEAGMMIVPWWAGKRGAEQPLWGTPARQEATGAVKTVSIHLRHPPECWHLCEWDSSRQVAEITVENSC